MGDDLRTRKVRLRENDSEGGERPAAAVRGGNGASPRGTDVGRQQSPFYALSFPNYRIFFVGQLVSVAGTWMQTVAQQWLVYDLTRSPSWLGIVSGASAVPYVLFAVWGGQVADRHPRRATLVWTQTLAMALAFVLALLATNWWVPVQAWHVAVVAGLSGVVNAFNMPAQQAFVSDIVDDRTALGNAIALNSLRFNLARFLGPVLAGAVLVKAGAAACFAVNGVSFLAVIASLLMLRLKPFVPKERDRSVWSGLDYIRRTRSVLRVVTLIGAGSLFAWSATTLFPVFAARFEAGPGGYSTMMAANGVGAAVGGFTVAWIGSRLPKRLLVYGGAALFSVALLLLSAAPTYHLLLACLVLSGFSMILFGISSNIKVQEEVPDELRGRVMAMYSLVFGGLMPLGGLQIGFLAERIGAVNAVRANAALCLLAACALFAWSQADRRSEERAGKLP